MSDEVLSFTREPIGKCFLDHRFFRAAREWVYGLDNRLFNRNGLIPDYQPTRRVLILPYYAAWIAVTWLFGAVLFMGAQQKMVCEQIFFCLLPLLMLVNVLFSLRHLFKFPNCGRKVLYALFIAAVTLGAFCLAFFVIFWLYFIVLMIVIFYIFRVLLSDSGKAPEPEPPQHVYKEEVIVDDGSLFGKTLTREGSGGAWKDSVGNVYEEHDGFFRKK